MKKKIEIKILEKKKIVLILILILTQFFIKLQFYYKFSRTY